MAVFLLFAIHYSCMTIFKKPSGVGALTTFSWSWSCQRMILSVIPGAAFQKKLLAIIAFRVRPFCANTILAHVIFPSPQVKTKPTRVEDCSKGVGSSKQMTFILFFFFSDFHSFTMKKEGSKIRVISINIFSTHSKKNKSQFLPKPSNMNKYLPER